MVQQELPIQLCHSRYCISEARFTDSRIVCLGDPQDTIIGWCPICEKMVCSRCCFKVPIPREQWSQLPEPEDIERACARYNVTPVALQCKRCGSFLGRYSDILVWKVIFA